MRRACFFELMLLFLSPLFMRQAVAKEAISSELARPGVGALISFAHGQFFDRMEDQSFALRDFSPIGLGVCSQYWGFLAEVYRFGEKTGNQTLEVQTQQTHFDFSMSRNLGSIWLFKPYLGGVIKLFRIDADTRVGSMARSDSSALLYSGGVLTGLNLIELGSVVFQFELRAFKHERFDPDPSPQGLFRLLFQL